MQRIRFLLCAIAFAVLSTGCPEAPEPPHLLYSQDPQSNDNPFPDLRLLKDGSFQSRPDWFRSFLPQTAIKTATVRLLNTWSSQATIAKGFGNLGVTIINASEPIDPASLPGTVARLRKVGDAYEILEENVAVEHATDALIGTDKTADANFPGYLIFRPSVVLPEGDEGLLVVKKGMKTKAGAELGRGHEFAKEAGSKEKIAAAAKALGVKEDDVLLVLPLKAERVTDPMKALAEWTKSAPAPQYTIPAKGDAAGGPVGSYTPSDTQQWNAIRDFLERHSFARPAQYAQKVVIGTFKARDLRDNGVWKPEWVANPDSAPQVDLYFTIVLPGGPKPAGGWRTVLGGHGLNGLNSVVYNNAAASFCLEVGEMITKAGFACIGIDAASHGRRGSSFDFFSLDNLTIARDNFRQTAFDMMQLSKLAQALDLDADGTADLNPELGYFGNSLGGIMGANFLSFDPRVKFGVLNVPGGGLSNILTSPVIRDQVGLLLVAKTNLQYQSLDYYAAIPVFRVLGQLMLEQGDPINLAQAMDNRPVLIQMGVDDLTIPNLTTFDLAKTLKAAELTANKTDASGIRAMSRMDPKVFIPSRAAGYNGHNIFWEIEAAPARSQAMKFLQSKGTEFIVE